MYKKNNVIIIILIYRHVECSIYRNVFMQLMGFELTSVLN